MNDSLKRIHESINRLETKLPHDKLSIHEKITKLRELKSENELNFYLKKHKGRRSIMKLVLEDIKKHGAIDDLPLYRALEIIEDFTVVNGGSRFMLHRRKKAMIDYYYNREEM